jgi:phosphatidate cytidylyltransferase
MVFLMVVIFGLLSEFGILPGMKFGFFQELILLMTGMSLPIFSWLGVRPDYGFWIPVFCAVWFLLELSRRELKGSLLRSASGIFALVLFAYVPTLAFDLNRASPYLALLPLIFVWTADTAAYFAGKTIGGPKMSPMLSPNKTWAGFAGEIIGGIAVCIIFKLIQPDLFGWDILIFGFAAGLIAVLGDLFESKVKRDLCIKDSSAAIPGHGGFWDRFDSWLFVQLWAWIYFIGH